MSSEKPIRITSDASRIQGRCSICGHKALSVKIVYHPTEGPERLVYLCRRCYEIDMDAEHGK